MTNTINQTHDFSVWLLGVTDVLARAAILVRIKRAAPGNFGDCHDVGSSVWEMRIHTGPGYRVYYARDGLTVYLLLAGGSKQGQISDIARAKAMWQRIRQERK
ncbi:MAG: addiction module antitoxin RelB [Caballeronia sp.]|jgi:putative addiction module killer protein|uniref:type II toxin-antitoxin system RelE/ParE family toxin n=1 Tax=Caballeronia sp. TaxID=1931223 RepID=UPI00260728E4|nr:type II toxin-antitoxin system RelE/ParE family toxin [Caballeronia sp.]MDB5837995.1 addiction module antitoxin RelB [Caballeronia sp.]